MCSCVLLGASVLNLSSCQSAPVLSREIIDSKITFQESLFGEEDFLILQNDRLPASIGVKKNNLEIKANLLLCTHKNCELMSSGNFLVCPCHGSEFDQNGKVLAGPAMIDLLALPVVRKNKLIEVNVKNLV